MKQILLSMNEKEAFIIEDLDEYHLIIKADDEYRVRKELDTEVRTSPSIFEEVSKLSILFSWKRIHIAWRQVNDPLYRIHNLSRP